ncbi:MAG: hypothetical protein ACO1RT_18205, partial [Planctomycetaceae bacterium]
QFPADNPASRRSFAPANSYQEETAAMNASNMSVAAGVHDRERSSISAPSTPEQDGSARPAAQRLALSPVDSSLPLEQRPAEVLRLAIETFPQTDNWVIFYREILGVEGVVRKLFRNVDELQQWEASKEFAEVHTMLAALRSHDTGKGDTIEAQRMITVRLPMSLHEALKLESKEQNLSINKLCITKLLHKMDSRFVPQELGKRRGRKPGPQGKRALKTNG